MPRFFLLCLLLFSRAASASCHAIIFSGGDQPSANYQVHIEQVAAFYSSLRSQGCRPEDIQVLVASGNANANDFASSSTQKPGTPGVKVDYGFLDRGTQLTAATAKNLSSAILKTARVSRPGDKIFISVLDHGDKNGIVPWRSAEISPSAMQQMLAQVPSDRQVKLWTECCYCGSFTAITLPNTCIATSTDSGHAGDYEFEAWSNYFSPNNWFIRTIKNMFASNLKSNPKQSFREIAQHSQIENSNSSYNSFAKQQGDSVLSFGQCHMGPRDSAEAYKLSVIGLDGGSYCFSDMIYLLNGRTPGCSLGAVSSVINLAQLIQGLPAIPVFAQMEKDFASVDAFIKAAPEYAAILKLDQDFSRLTAREKLASSVPMQRRSRELREALVRKITGRFGVAMDRNWATVLDVAFYKSATSEQKQHLRELNTCLNSPVL